MTRENAKIVRLDDARYGAPVFAPQYLIATVGLCLAALPVVDGLACGSTAWIGAVGGGGALVLAIGSAIRPRCWQACAQAILGGAVAVAPATMPSSSISDSVAALCGGIVISLSALTHIAELQRARERDRHRGWRSASRPASRGPRLAYAADAAADRHIRTASPTASMDPGHEGVRGLRRVKLADPMTEEE